MLPKSLSASAAAAYEGCPARWKAEFHEKPPQPSSTAADLGTTVHAALEDYVKGGFEPGTGSKANLPILEKHYLHHYAENFVDDTRKAEGLQMIRTWFERTDFCNRVVLSTEVKTSFDIPTSQGPIPFNYIWDRCDLLEGPWSENGELRVEVIDYKTVSRPISPEGLKDKIQARCYGLAAQLQYPDANQIWVTFDLLRFEPVGIVFSKDENRATWRYLRALAERIILLDSDEPFEEKLNSECHYCIRRHECASLKQHIDAGGVLASGDPFTVAHTRHKMDLQRKALEKMIAELDTFLLDWSEKEEMIEWETDALRVVVSARKTRDIDSQLAADVVNDPTLIKRYGKIGVTAIDKMIKDGVLKPAQVAELRDLMTNKFGEAKISTFEKNPIDSSL